jgi:DAK2 domain fusion protein YloV
MIATASKQETLRLSCTGYELREMLSAATRWLEKNAPAINALNVFPVPDGDTGTNMLLTMRSMMEEAAGIQEDDASVMSQALARGALMGARGNSGVILSQIFKGFASGLDGTATFGPQEMAQALEKASALAYRSMSSPKEGTILTVIKDVAVVARDNVGTNAGDLADLVGVAVQEARSSVERTPELLDVLKEAGVVDAGGQGLCIILEGILHYLRGEAESIESMEVESPLTLQPALKAARSLETRSEAYGYCTTFIIKGQSLSADQVREELEPMGDSIVVVGDDTTVKIHIHTPQPGAILDFGISYGSLHDIKIQNMDEQHEEFLQMRRAPVPAAEIAIVSVVCGGGLEDVFCSLGTSAIVPGGQTMNPSTEEIMRAIDSIPSGKVIVLPNNKNVVLTARQAAAHSSKKVQVLPTEFIPQGVAALLAFSRERELENNLYEMDRAQKSVKSIEITRAVRKAKVGKTIIDEGQFIGLIDGKLKTANDDLWPAVSSTVKAANVDEAEIITLYYGADVQEEEAENLGQALRSQFPALPVEIVQGGQPHYHCIISVEY